MRREFLSVLLIALCFVGLALLGSKMIGTLAFSESSRSAISPGSSASLKSKGVAPSTVTTSSDATATSATSETATFAAGCFWGTEEFFRKLPGVISTRVGFTGGHTENPKYDDTHDGHTGHAESVEIVFNPTKISYVQLMDSFYKMHDPTTLNRQGNDVGTQYRSAIFYHGNKQKAEALSFKAKVEESGAWKAPIITEISPAGKFWPAEDEHQKYLVKHPGGYDNHYLRHISFDTSKKATAAAPKGKG